MVTMVLTGMPSGVTPSEGEGRRGREGKEKEGEGRREDEGVVKRRGGREEGRGRGWEGCLFH